jgi:hypothetical protein
MRTAGSHSSTRKLATVRLDDATSVPERSAEIASFSAAWHSRLVRKPPLVRCRRLPVTGSGPISSQ